MVESNVYDEVAYPGRSISYTHPDRLAVIGTLLGMKPMPVEQCRVLELGCGDGGNLLPMAEMLPGSEFTGFDYTARHVEAASEGVAALGLANIRFEQRDIRDISPADGMFDYIICHGVYSWVPRDVRDAVLRVCNENLAPQGIAYVSFNVLPGWYYRQPIRDLMRFRTRRMTDARERVQAAHEFAAFAARALPADSSPHGFIINQYVDDVRAGLDAEADARASFSLHDELAEVNDPCYFVDFIDHAGRHGLRFLADVDMQVSLPDRFPSWVNEELERVAESVEEMEQYRDMLTNRVFRRVLLCHQEVDLDRSLSLGLDTLGRFYFRTEAKLAEGASVEGDGAAEFVGPEQGKVALGHPPSKAAMAYLAEQFPRAVPFRELVEVALTRAGAEPSAQSVGPLVADLMHTFTYSDRLLSLHLLPFPGATVVSERPLATKASRWEASRGLRFVTNAAHMLAAADPVDRYLLPLLDGTHTRADLLAALRDLAERGELDPGGEADPGESVEGRLARQLDEALLDFAYHGLLLA